MAAETRGRLLVIEGIDGCGKSTQLQALAAWLPVSGLLPAGAELRLTREPGGTPLGQALRQLLLDPPGAAAPEPTAELLLYAADRAQHVQQCITPALAAGHWVLSDRFSGSTAAYQGYGRGLPLVLIDQLEQIATAGLVPDLTLWLELPLAEATRRRHRRQGPGQPDRIEAAGDGFLAKVHQGFARLAAERGWQPIAADQPLEQVTAACQQALRQRLTAAAVPGRQP
ncbi:MAG: dTMP kinase [Cyanobacteriota bacterium]|nr:dTMP kinase [Cyanobacteriota bacterium]